MDVLLVSMPFGPLYSPSLGLSLLMRSLENEGHSVKIKYFLIEFAKKIGTDFYTDIANGFPLNHDMAGEWIFSSSLFGHDNQKIHSYFHEIMMGNNPHHSKEKYSCVPPDKKFFQKLIRVQQKVGDFIENCLQEVISLRPRVIGFTSVFQQQLASLFLAKRIKETDPDIQIVFGGANNEGIMGLEYIHQFPFIDAVVSGEGDMVFHQLVRRLKDGEDISDLKGVICKTNIHRYDHAFSGFSAEPVKDMDILPFPGYDDYFEQIKNSQIRLAGKPRILFESSRGCWWGEKMHCTFCGLNGENMKHRSKSSQRVLNELDYLTDKYKGHAISVVDNILDMNYFKTLIPELAKDKDNKPALFYEVKSNLKQEQVMMLKLAGITTIQPGIESLSDKVLKLMRKGVKAIQNIQLLKWCKEYGISAEWNVLWGFPGEDPEEYRKIAELIPSISHLQPPHGSAPIRLDRFSPNFDTPDELGFKDLSPYPAYEYIFPFRGRSLYNVAYFFTYEYKEPQQVEDYALPVSVQIKNWKKNQLQSDLFSVDKGDFLLIWDFRPIAVRHLITLKGLQRQLYLYCDKIRTADQLLEQCRADHPEADLAVIHRITAQFIKAKIMLTDKIHFLSLAVALNEYYSPNGIVIEKLNNYIREAGSYQRTTGLTTINQFEEPFLVTEEESICNF